ncbi:MAG: hemerythrin domain-containing protein [Deltaproteobacteria bacterium]|nr:hemerythrin domain-containing protein [Deltaproteobacteria bacterium]
MWRHPALRPFAREHFAALMAVRDVRWAAQSGRTELVDRANRGLARAWQLDLAAHFEREDRFLRPLLTSAEQDELDAQHADLRAQFGQLVAAAVPDPDLALHCAVALHDHVRWEESVLFESLQARCGGSELAQALAGSDRAPD